MKLSLVAAGCVLFAGIAGAAQPTSMDFAFGMPLTLDGEAAVYRLPVPVQVYRHTVREDLGDVRVFNADDEAVPYSLWTTVVQAAAREPAVPLPMFPLRGDPVHALDAFKITIASGKTAFDVQAPSSTLQPQVEAYVIDARGLEKAIAALELHWPADAAEFSGQVDLSSSDDLGSWRLIATGLPIANLNFAGRQLVQGRVEFPAVRAKFFRLSWQGRPAPFVLSEVLAETARAQAEPLRSQMAVTGHVAPGKSDIYEFDVQAHAPVDRIDLQSSQPNTFVQVVLSSRDRMEDPWRRVTASSVYRLQSDGREIRSPPIRIAADSDRYWQMQVQPAGGIGRTDPTLQLSWIPHEITFVARGRGPFQLAFGSAVARSAASSLEGLIGEKTQIRVGAARVGEMRTLGRGEDGGGEGIGVEEVDVVGVLGVAVMGLAWMAFRLSREMKGAE